MLYSFNSKYGNSSCRRGSKALPSLDMDGTYVNHSQSIDFGSFDAYIKFVEDFGNDIDGEEVWDVEQIECWEVSWFEGDV
jgi:hypothetical protein